MSERLAHFVSYALHPLLMPTYALLLLFNMESYVIYSISLKHLGIIAGLNLVNTAIMPALFLLVLYRLNKVSNLHLNSQYERTLPFLIGLFFYFFNYYIFRSSALPQIIVSMTLAGALVVLIAFLLNFRFKISIHAISISCVAGIFMGMSQVLNQQMNFKIMALIILSGLVGSARLRLNAHSPFQVYAGAVVGLVVGFVCVYLKLG